MEAARLEGSMKERLTFMAALKSSRAKPTLPTFFSSTPQAWKTKTVSRLLGSAHTPSWNNSRARSWLPCSIRKRVKVSGTEIHCSTDLRGFLPPRIYHCLNPPAHSLPWPHTPAHPVGLRAQIPQIALPPLRLTLSASRHKSPQMPPCTLTRSASMQPQACQR